MRKLDEIGVLDGGHVALVEGVVEEALDDGCLAGAARAHHDDLEAALRYQRIVALLLLRRGLHQLVPALDGWRLLKAAPLELEGALERVPGAARAQLSRLAAHQAG